MLSIAMEITDLPLEILLTIFLKLKHLRYLASVSKVCQKFKEVCRVLKLKRSIIIDDDFYMLTDDDFDRRFDEIKPFLDSASKSMELFISYDFISQPFMINLSRRMKMLTHLKFNNCKIDEDSLPWLPSTLREVTVKDMTILFDFDRFFDVCPELEKIIFLHKEDPEHLMGHYQDQNMHDIVDQVIER